MPRVLPTPATTGTRAERQHSRSPGVALSHNPEKELLSIYEVTKALRFKKKHKLAQVCLTDWWWLSQHACMLCVQFGGSLMAIHRKRPRGLVGLSLSSAAPPREPEPEFCVCLARPCRTPRAWNAACLPVVVLTRCPVQWAAGKSLLTQMPPCPWLHAAGHKTAANILSDNPPPGSRALGKWPGGPGWVMGTPAVRSQVRNEPRGQPSAGLCGGST